MQKQKYGNNWFLETVPTYRDAGTAVGQESDRNVDGNVKS